MRIDSDACVRLAKATVPARAHDEALLTAANADLVVTSLDEIDVPALGEHQLQQRTS